MSHEDLSWLHLSHCFGWGDSWGWEGHTPLKPEKEFSRGKKNPSCSAVYAVPSSGPFRSEWIFDPLNYHLAFGSHGHKRIKPQMVLEHWWSYLNLRVSRFGIWQYDLNLKYNDTCFGYLRKIMLFFLLSEKNGWPVEMRDCCTLLYVFLAYSQRSSSEECTAVFAAGGRGKY